jgi:short-subunit dehydrogenase
MSKITFIVLLTLAGVLNGCTTWKPGKSGQRKLGEKTFVILGASSGFGRGIAEELGRYKAKVVIAARRTELLNEIADSIRKYGGTVTVVTADISKPEDIKRLAATAVKEYGKIDVWINMAGIATIGRFWDTPPADLNRVIDVNLNGFINASYTAIDVFRKQGYGTLINMGSVDSEVPMAYQTAYAASKAGVRSFSLALAQELRIAGYDRVKVVTIEPWAADTPFWRHSANYSGGTPSMAALDDPQKIVNAVLRKSLRPRKEVPVGWKARGISMMHRHMPRFTERIAANVAHKYQYKAGPPVPDTVGAIYQPMPSGRGIDDNVREREKREKKHRK